MEILPPSNVTADGGVNKIYLNWKEVKGAVNYNVYQHTNSQDSTKFVKNVSIPHLVIDQLPYGEEFCFTINGVDQDGDLNPKRDFKKDKFDHRDGVKKKKPKGKIDRTELGQKSKKGRPGMSRPFPPMMGEGFMPPMMGERFQTRESEIFQEIEQIFSAILDSLISIEELSSDTSKATDEEISQSGELTLSLIEELIKETFDERFEEEISELVDRVAKDALTQIIRGLDQESVEQSLEGVTESN